jgi:hypothetical protein
MIPLIRTRALKLLAALLLPACAAWHASGIRPVHPDASAAPQAEAAVEWPVEWRGRALRPLALTDTEQRFAQGFPGKIVRLTDEWNMLVWRHVARPTRMLHPAVDCYRAVGWRIRDERLEQANNDTNERWRCFIAEREHGGARLRVCERIEDNDGQGFTDTSAWYWAAITGQSAGPWRAVTVASPL